MKLTRKNNKRSITLTRNEMLEIARRHDEAFYFDPDEFYDTEEIKAAFPDEMTIDEDMIGVTEKGFWMYEEDFWNQFRVHAEESDDDTDDYEIEYFFYDYENEDEFKEETIMKATKKTYVMTKSYEQWDKALDYLINAGEAYYLLYGNIECALSEHDEKQLDKRLPILVQWELDEYERDAVKEEWEYIKNIK